VDRGRTPAVGQAAGTARGAATPFSEARPLLALVCALCAGLSGCLGDGGDDEPEVIQGDVATVYSSAPRHGVSATAAGEVMAGERGALEERGGRAGGLRIRLRQLPATDERGRPWDPALVAENAHRAADDPTAIAYLGELDYGASAVSLPITNDAGILQVSPGDGLTSLTRRPPGRPRAGPERYYPTDHRSFVRVGPTDLSEVERLVELLQAAGAARFAFVFDREIYGRELAAQLVERARRAGLTPVASEEYRGRVDDIPDIARSLADKRPQAVVQLGVAGAGTLPMMNAIADQLPGVPVFAASGMLAAPRLALPPAPELEVVGPELQPRRAGYEAMRLVLDAIGEGGRDRRRVVSAGLRRARDLPGDGIVVYRPGPDGHIEPAGP
jgi:branched-chain amino acid transport system substrate-binding protein